MVSGLVITVMGVRREHVLLCGCAGPPVLVHGRKPDTSVAIDRWLYRLLTHLHFRKMEGCQLIQEWRKATMICDEKALYYPGPCSSLLNIHSFFYYVYIFNSRDKG